MWIGSSIGLNKTMNGKAHTRTMSETTRTMERDGVCLWHLYLLGTAFILRKSSIFMLFYGERWLSVSKICKTDTSASSVSLFQNKLDWTFIERFIRASDRERKRNKWKKKTFFPSRNVSSFWTRSKLPQNLYVIKLTNYNNCDRFYALVLNSCRWIAIGHTQHVHGTVRLRIKRLNRQPFDITFTSTVELKVLQTNQLKWTSL